MIKSSIKKQFSLSEEIKIKNLQMAIDLAMNQVENGNFSSSKDVFKRLKNRQSQFNKNKNG